jgi:rhodanese-related sulfurtransferase
MHRFPIKQISTIFLLAVVPAILTGWLHPKRPSWSSEQLQAGEVSLAQAIDWGESVLWVDARSSVLFERGHVPHAISLNEDDWEALLPELMRRWKPGMKIVVYCDSRECRSSHLVADRLKKGGVSSVHVLHGGWEVWEKQAR